MYMKVIPYSGKLSREKTFADFAVLELSAKVFSAKFWGRGVLGGWASSQRVVKITVMPLLKYFQLSNSTLPKADGPLSQVIPSSSITAPNKVPDPKGIM